MFSASQNPVAHSKKRLFIGLLLASLLLLAGTLAAAWWIVSRRGLWINKVILTVVTATIIVFLIFLATGLTALVWSLWRAKTIPSLQSMMSTATNLLFPLAVYVGKWVGLDEEKIKNSYIQVSNQLVKSKIKSHPHNKIMVLAPHCLQWTGCPRKITIAVENCARCGKCQIASLIQLSARYGARLRIVTGGTAARKEVKECRPEAVVAIACERDLTSGIQDVIGLPVMGVVNERPEGPCANTRVDLNKVEDAINYFLKGG